MNTLKLQITPVIIETLGLTEKESTQLAQIKIEGRVLTPAEARSLWDKNTENRKFRKSQGLFFSREIASGRFRCNGETIILDEFGNPMQGQHRIWGCMEANRAIFCIVVSGVPREWFGTIDNCVIPRTAGDVLETPQAKSVGAALRHIYRYLNAEYFQGGTKLSNTQIQSLFAAFPGIIESVRICSPATPIIRSVAVSSGLHFLFSHIDSELADQFIGSIASGENLQKGTAIYAVRERLVANSMSTAKLPMDYIAAFLIKSWNAHRRNDSVELIKFAIGKEPFPMIEGLPAGIYDVLKNATSTQNT